jgi:hypothetical protein
MHCRADLHSCTAVQRFKHLAEVHTGAESSEWWRSVAYYSTSLLLCCKAVRSVQKQQQQMCHVCCAVQAPIDDGVEWDCSLASWPADTHVQTLV